jgi:hypothetical protein
MARKRFQKIILGKRKVSQLSDILAIKGFPPLFGVVATPKVCDNPKIRGSRVYESI